MDSLQRIAERVNKPLVLDMSPSSSAKDVDPSANSNRQAKSTVSASDEAALEGRTVSAAADSLPKESPTEVTQSENVKPSASAVAASEGRGGSVKESGTESMDKRKVDSKNFSGEKKMSGNVVEVQSVERVNDARNNNRRSEPVMLALPTSDKSVAADMTSIDVDPVVERISTVISQSAVNNGVMKSNEGILIQGTQIGDIEIDTTDLDSKEGTVVVSRTGVVKGDIRGKRVVVFGRVEGAIKSVTSLILAESAVVTGDIAYRQLRMMDGSEVEGSVKKLKEDEI